MENARISSGDIAPDFTLYNSARQQVTLSAQRGNNILLLFFPFAFSSTCTTELCSVRNNISIYNSLNAKVFGISVDSLYTLARFKEEQKLNFTLLSDFNKEVSKCYGSLYDKFGYEMRGVSKRAVFLIDGEGIVQYAEVLENADLQPDFKAMVAVLSSFTK